MLDEDFKVYLIEVNIYVFEVNTNPCLEISSTLLARLIPNMIENVMRFIILIQNSYRSNIPST